MKRIPLQFGVAILLTAVANNPLAAEDRNQASGTQSYSNAASRQASISNQRAEGFTQAFRTVDIAAAELGVLAQMLVREGDEVTVNQILAKLDDRVLAESLEVSRISKDATGALRAAMSERDSRQRQFEILQGLHQGKHATKQEMQRATLALAVAEAKLQTVREDLDVKRAEYQRTKVQIQRRQLVSPIDGIVVDIKKDVGEFVSPTEPTVLTVVQLSKLKVVFSVHQSWTKNLKAGQRVELNVGDQRVPVAGVIEFVSPQVDPKSGTATVKVSLDNTNRNVPCGVICRWDGKTSGFVMPSEGKSAMRRMLPYSLVEERR